MAVIRVNKTANYTVMSNTHFKEKEMSLKAKGLLSLMLSLPDDWDYSIAGLVAICKENESAINSTLKELKEFGYLEVRKLMPNETESGRIEYIYDIYEQPHEKQAIKKQGVENQGVVFQGVENPLQLNTKQSITKQSNNEVIKTIVEYLNSVCGSAYKPTTPKTQTLIKARFQEGFVFDDFKTVIDKKFAEWKGTEWERFLCPDTLFSTKFERYLNEKVTKKAPTKQTSDNTGLNVGITL